MTNDDGSPTDTDEQSATDPDENSTTEKRPRRVARPAESPTPAEAAAAEREGPVLGIDDDQNWEPAGREALVTLMESQLDDLRIEVEDTAVAVGNGFAVDSTHVSRLRNSVAAMERTVEESLARLAEGTEPWERSTRRIPDWRLREQLGLDPVGVAEGGEDESNDAERDPGDPGDTGGGDDGTGS